MVKTKAPRAVPTRPAADGVAGVARRVIESFGDVLLPQAVRIVTPMARRVPLAEGGLDAALAGLVSQYEPRTVSEGLYPHQAELLSSLHARPDHHYILTSATGSGKSLCFWVWLLDQLRRDPAATALVCFPTQALLWGQAERLARISPADTLAVRGGGPGSAHAGTLAVGDQRIGWTIWHGTGYGWTKDPVMAAHQQSDEFRAARIRLCTVDKAHYSLLKGHREFAARLRCLVLDEAHTYDGVFGANVHFFLRRLYLACGLLGRERPRTFLASATLSAPRAFAQALCGIEDEKQIVAVADGVGQQIDLVPCARVPEVLADPPRDGLCRVVLLAVPEDDQFALRGVLRRGHGLDDAVKAVYFAQSKFQSRQLALELARKRSGGEVVAYDADLPPPQRRALERRLNDPDSSGITVLATSALELGVDIEGLDVCVMDQLPSRRADLLQRIGRVGRRVGAPGLVLLRLGAGPQDAEILEDPATAFRLDLTRPMRIPLHLDGLRLRHMFAAFEESRSLIDAGRVRWREFNRGLEQHFGESPMLGELRDRFAARYGALVDMGDRAWVYKGFRAGVSGGKIPLLCEGQEVARIEDIALFRDAHPEAVFLGHDLGRYRIVDYSGPWKVARWEHPESAHVLGKMLKSVDRVVVEPEARRVTTRGSWEESNRFYAPLDLGSGDGLAARPAGLEFGIWDYTRRWRGYTEIDLETGKKRWVPLAEVTERFAAAKSAGDRFPFLFPLSYRTLGWRWESGPLREEKEAKGRDLAEVVGALLLHFCAGAVESRIEDLLVEVHADSGRLEVLDATPGGNGLSEALLAEGRMPRALAACVRELERLCGAKRRAEYERYLRRVCRLQPECAAEEVLNAVQRLHQRWGG